MSGFDPNHLVPNRGQNAVIGASKGALLGVKGKKKVQLVRLDLLLSAFVGCYMSFAAKSALNLSADSSRML